jgi:hypothetical protein
VLDVVAGQANQITPRSRRMAAGTKTRGSYGIHRLCVRSMSVIGRIIISVHLNAETN